VNPGKSRIGQYTCDYNPMSAMAKSAIIVCVQ